MILQVALQSQFARALFCPLMSAIYPLRWRLPNALLLGSVSQKWGMSYSLRQAPRQSSACIN